MARPAAQYAKKICPIGANAFATMINFFILLRADDVIE
jgi:hypothetical protein